MSTPDQPDTPPLTRRQLRQLRDTGAIPIVDPTAEGSDRPRTPRPEIDESSIDLNAPPRSRREARIQERLRTAALPVIGAEDATDEAAAEVDDTVVPELVPVDESVTDAVDADASEQDDAAEDAEREPSDGIEDDAVEDEAVESEVVEGESLSALEEAVGPATIEAETIEPVADAADAAADADLADDEVTELVQVDEVGEPVTGDESDTASSDAPDAADDDDEDGGDGDVDVDAPTGAEPKSARTVDEGFGAELLAGNDAEVELPASFDQLLTRATTTTGSIATPNALILSQTPDAGPLVNPISATGEVLITGSYNLPDTLGSTGSAPGTQDNKETDAVLVDGELPAHSSPTPLAASSAVSSVKAADDVIRPPAPEKGSRIMMILAITAGVLAVALAGVLILAFVTGVFSQ